MTKIYIDYEDLRVNNNLKEACSYLKMAKDIYLNVPRDFSKSGRVREIEGILNTTYNELNNILLWLKDSQKKYSDFEMDAIGEISRMEKVEVTSNSSIVK